MEFAITYNLFLSTGQKIVYRTAKKNDRNDLTIETIEKFCSSGAKLRSCSIVSIVVRHEALD